MPMSKETFANELVKTTDPDHPDFVGFPVTPEEVAEAWMNALKAMFLEAVNPTTAAGSAAAAAEAGIPPFAALIIDPPPLAPPLGLAALAAGYAAFAAVIATGGAAEQAIPPPAPFVPVFGPPTPDPLAAALVLGQESLDWAVTGLADPPATSPPESPWE